MHSLRISDSARTKSAGMVKRLLTAGQKHAKHNPGGRGQASIEAWPQVKKVTFYQ
jgi:hypothetical protein